MVFQHMLDWWRRRDALRQMASMRRRDESTLTLSDSHPFAWALNAASLGDRKEGLRHWRDACQKYPDFVRNSPDSLKLLLDLESYDEAEGFAQDAYKRSPRDPVRAAGPATVSESRGDFAEAAARWAKVRRKFPQQPRAYAGEASSLSQLGKLDEADALIGKAIARFPNDPVCGIEAGRIADRRKDWPTALARWENVSQTCGHYAGDIGVARALQELGRLDEAERRLQTATLQFPLVVEFAIGLAEVAYRRREFANAVSRWATVRAKFPTLPFGYQGGFRVSREVGDLEMSRDVVRAALDRFPNAPWALEISQELAGLEAGD